MPANAWRFSLLAAAFTAATAVASAAAQTVRDSAGIQIVESRAPALAAPRAWRVDPKPTLVIGDPATISAGDSLYEFSLVMGVIRMADGRWAVGVQGSHAIRFYDGGGKFLGAGGRYGRGPGEFQQIMLLKPLAGDTLFVSDVGEVEYFTGQGKWIRQGAAEGRTIGDHFIFPAVPFDDGSYAGFDWNDRTERATPRGERSLPLLIVSRDGMKRDSVAVLPARSVSMGGPGQMVGPAVFAPSGVVAGNGRNLFYGFGSRYEIAEYSAARKPVRLIRRQFSPQPVTAAARADYQQHVLNSTGEDGRPMSAAMRARVEQSLAARVYAADYPAFAAMLVDRAGNLWVRHYDYRQALLPNGPVRVMTIAVATNWDIFDSRGRWLCTTELPARFAPLDVGADYVAGLARDADDVEMVKVYRLVKP